MHCTGTAPALPHLRLDLHVKADLLRGGGAKAGDVDDGDDLAPAGRGAGAGAGAGDGQRSASGNVSELKPRALLYLGPVAPGPSRPTELSTRALGATHTLASSHTPTNLEGQHPLVEDAKLLAQLGLVHCRRCSRVVG